MTIDQDYILRMENITKDFPGVRALDSVTFEVLPGEIHALMGANGAGKSTLMKVLAGIYSADDGSILLSGNRVHLHNPTDAQQKGISIVFQELNVIPHLSVLENIYLNRELRRGGLFYDWKQMEKRGIAIMEELEIDVDVNRRVKDLTIAQQQMVEIAKAVSTDAKIIVFDEPTSSLTGCEVDVLYRTMRKLQAKGVTLIYISHRLDEIYAICERITLLRDGAHVGTYDLANLTREQLVSNMIGRRVDDEFPSRKRNVGEEILRVRGLSANGHFEEISFELGAGEILGFAGLVGAGRTEVGKALFGILPYQSGEIYLSDRQIRPTSSRQALDLGIAYCTEDRKGEGLLLGRSIRENASLASIDSFIGFRLIDRNKESASVGEMYDSLSIKAPTIETRVAKLSGGNQQKVCLAKWLLARPRVIILDEPTRGIDVGTKHEFYKMINELAGNGVGIILISSEEEELMGLCDRIIVLRQGRINGEISLTEGDPGDNGSKYEQLMNYMLGTGCVDPEETIAS